MRSAFCFRLAIICSCSRRLKFIESVIWAMRNFSYLWRDFDFICYRRWLGCENLSGSRLYGIEIIASWMMANLFFIIIGIEHQPDFQIFLSDNFLITFRSNSSLNLFAISEFVILVIFHADYKFFKIVAKLSFAFSVFDNIN